MNGEPQLLIAIDRFSKWPTAKICKPSETSEYKKFCKSRNIKINYCPPQMHTGNGTVERAIQTMKNLILASMEHGNNLTKSVNRALRVMRFTIHTGLKKTPFELRHSRKPRTELTNIAKDGKSFLSSWSELSILAPNQPKIPIYVKRDADGEITNHIVMARTKTEERQLAADSKSQKINFVRYPFEFLEK